MSALVLGVSGPQLLGGEGVGDDPFQDMLLAPIFWGQAAWGGESQLSAP